MSSWDCDYAEDFDNFDDIDIFEKIDVYRDGFGNVYPQFEDPQSSQDSDLQFVSVKDYKVDRPVHVSDDKSAIRKNIESYGNYNSNAEAIRELQANFIAQIEGCKDWFSFCLFPSLNSK